VEIAPLTIEHVFDFEASLKPPVVVGRTRRGMRVNY